MHQKKSCIFAENKQTNKYKMTTQTTERTFNNKVKKQVLELMPTASSFVKKHVPGCGYVFYIKNQNNETIGNVSKTMMIGMLISIKTN